MMGSCMFQFIKKMKEQDSVSIGSCSSSVSHQEEVLHYANVEAGGNSVLEAFETTLHLSSSYGSDDSQVVQTFTFISNVSNIWCNDKLLLRV